MTTLLIPVERPEVREHTEGVEELSGNVCEWTRSTDEYFPDQLIPELADLNARNPRRVVRGGAFSDDPERLRSARRGPFGYRPTSRNGAFGFRVVVSPLVGPSFI